MLKKRKAQGISIRAIIIAIVAIVVLVVLIAAFTGRFGVFGKGIRSLGDPTKTCLGQSGSLEPEECPPGTVQIASRDASAKDMMCCGSGIGVSGGSRRGSSPGGGDSGGVPVADFGCNPKVEVCP